MFHYKLIELEAELLAKKQSQKGFAALPPECEGVLAFIEHEIEVPLGAPVPKDWRGWLCYRRKNSLVICRGRAFKDGGKIKAGLDIAHGQHSIYEHAHGFDVTPPQELDHLLLNFGGDENNARVFLWYGENIAPYKLIYAADVSDEPHEPLDLAVIEACKWILTRPKSQTLNQFLAQLAKQEKSK